ncbi:type IVB secretion system protein IcmH/DotU (plasmid) [Sinorhizobium medicae]|uniref:type IVB secretion system protein IcmH/DotU n=1 Tax=Sinorhizobium medicae TaxID=110321 RepID=UPI002AF6B060|nr:type IVB secretion system protein IcmH/DotU [Sinorhizobium medicae]WQO68746.1 type IVB secretion system protein IcmH/DotU [Sinorhizobium medicae]WQO75783.1 type IVB secretion system protein IcmH/DotU [Sinorhizobium medicae]WQO94947.1 type IVB secretion system protein IcmH/DotU [Sinorhizobium medicae]
MVALPTEGTLLSREPASTLEPAAVSRTVNPRWEALTLHRLNPLVAAAAALLSLSAQLKSGVDQVDVEELRPRVLREIDAFERRILPLGLPTRAIKISTYALCATIDDIVLSTAWGSQSIWATRSMVGTVFGETWGGDRFFELLQHMKKDPATNIELLELLYYCMRMGFEGRFRVAARGASELVMLCEDAYNQIRAARSDSERDLSTHWKERAHTRGPLRRPVPSWTIAAFGAAFLLSLYMGLHSGLNDRSDMVLTELADLPPSSAVKLVRATTPGAVVKRSNRLHHFLESEIHDGFVTVTEDAQQILVTIRGSGLFDPSSSIVKASFVPLLLRIGRALNDQPGAVVLTGHTDSRPIRSLAYRSNADLSMARAIAAGETIKSTMNEPGRVREQGRGSGEPIASNQTPEGRAKNRRIEIIITKPN